jgi:hypothetical protein
MNKKLFVLKRDNGHLLRFAAAVSGTALVLTFGAAAEIFRRRARARTVRKTDRLELLRSLYRKGRVSQTLDEPVAAISAQGM